MRDYLSETTFWRACALGAVATLMSTPRILRAGLDPALYVPSAFLAMTLVAGAVVAWGRCGGMHGMFPNGRRLAMGVLVALVLALMAAPLQHVWLDPILRQAISGARGQVMIGLRYPDTIAGCLAVMLWVASFEVLFFQAGTLSFAARLTGSPWVGVALSVFLRLFVVSRQLTSSGIHQALPEFFTASALASGVCCWLFARYGLPAAMVFSAGLNLHLVWRLV